MKAITKVVKVSDNVRAVLKAVTGEQLMQAAQAGAGVIETYAKLNASSGRPGLQVDTGNLVNSIHVEKGEQRENYAEAITTTGAVEYAAIHEFGGIIRPLHKRFLSWVDKKSGERIFAKLVQIPARPYMRPAVDEHEDDIQKAVEYQLIAQIGSAAK